MTLKGSIEMHHPLDRDKRCSLFDQCIVVRSASGVWVETGCGIERMKKEEKCPA